MSEASPGTGSGPYPSAPGDTLLFENAQVRVWSFTLEPGVPSPFHQHHHDHIVLWPKPGRAEAHEIGGEEWSLVQVAQSGFVSFRTAREPNLPPPHRIRNTGPERNTHYVVELLEPSPVELPPVQVNGRGRVGSRPTDPSPPPRPSDRGPRP